MAMIQNSEESVLSQLESFLILSEQLRQALQDQDQIASERIVGQRSHLAKTVSELDLSQIANRHRVNLLLSECLAVNQVLVELCERSQNEILDQLQTMKRQDRIQHTYLNNR
jgi:hypothetical protein